MAITIKPANLYEPLKSHKFMKSMASGGLARFIALEAFVETGRTYQAYKRGGFDEGRERITEEFTGAVFWLGGVKAFNKINDKIGKWLLNMRTTEFDIGSDKARDTIKNFIHNETDTKKGAKFTEKQIGRFKAIKLIASILMANAMIGFVVPKINQSITRYYHRNDKKNNQIQPQEVNNIQNTAATLKRLTLNDYIDKTSKKENENPTFGAASPFSMMNIAYNLENSTTWQLLSTDVGTASGRAISARNNNERREILFRDLSSIYFYMFNMPLMNSWLNKLEQKGRSTRADSMNVHYTTDLMKQIVAEKGGSISADNLHKEMFGEFSDYKFGSDIKEKFQKGYMSIEEFKKEIPKVVPESEVSKYTKIAEEMAKLQPPVEGIERITLDQAERVFKGGYLNNPEFLKNLYELSFGKNKKLDIANFLNPYKYISSETIEGIDGDLKYYVEQIIDKAKKANKDITSEVLEKASKANFKFNVLNWGAGFAISALFLSTLIPKIQYWITKRVTGTNEFPGTAEFREKQAANGNIKTTV